MSGWWRMASDRIEQFRHEDAALADDPALGYVPDQARSIWRTSQLYDIKDSDDLAQLHVGYDIIRHLLRAHAELGGRVLAGSDTYLSVPGLSLQRELLFLVDTGFTPLEAIRMATLDNAVFMDLADDLGSVEPGKLADLVVLDADPTAAIENIGRVASVYRGGEPVDLTGPPKLPTAATGDGAAAVGRASPARVRLPLHQPSLRTTRRRRLGLLLVRDVPPVSDAVGGPQRRRATASLTTRHRSITPHNRAIGASWVARMRGTDSPASACRLSPRLPRSCAASVGRSPTGTCTRYSAAGSRSGRGRTSHCPC